MWLEELGVTERLVFYVFCAVAALDLVLALAVLVVGIVYRINTPGASLDFYIAFGSLALMVTTLVRGADPEWGTISQLESLCVFFPSIMTFGLLWFLGGLLLKACAIQNYFKFHAGDSIRAHEWKPNLWMILLMILDAVIVLVWLLRYEPELVPRDASGNALNKNISMSDWDPDFYFTCEGEKFDTWMIVVSVVHALILLLAGILVWVAVHNARRTPASLEATLLSIAIYNAIFGVIGATLVHFYFDGDKSTNYAIVGGIQFYVIFLTLLLVLVMKVSAARRLKYSRKRTSSHYDKVDDDRGSYRRDNYVNETRLPKKKKKDKKVKKVKAVKTKEKKHKKDKASRKSKASSKSRSSKRSSNRDRDVVYEDEYVNERYDSYDERPPSRGRYDDYNDRASSRDRGSARGSAKGSHRDRESYYNDSRGGHDNRGYESNRTSKVYNDSRGSRDSYREERRSSYREEDRGSYRGSDHRGSERGSNRQSEFFAY